MMALVAVALVAAAAAAVARVDRELIIRLMLCQRL